jgi:hypothetical protein
MFIGEYIRRIIRISEQFADAGLPVPQDRMPSNYYHLMRSKKKAYFNSKHWYLPKPRRAIPSSKKAKGSLEKKI